MATTTTNAGTAGAGPITVKGPDGKPYSGRTASGVFPIGLNEWNRHYGIILLNRPVPWIEHLPAVGEVMPEWIRQLADMAENLVTTIMWSNPHTTKMPDHREYYQKGFYQLPNGRFLVFSLTDGKRFKCSRYVLEESHHEEYAKLGSFDVSTLFPPPVQVPQALVVAPAPITGQFGPYRPPQQSGTSVGYGENVALRQPAGAPRPSQQLIFQSFPGSSNPLGRQAPPSVPYTSSQGTPQQQYQTFELSHAQPLPSPSMTGFQGANNAVDLIALAGQTHHDGTTHGTSLTGNRSGDTNVLPQRSYAPMSTLQPGQAPPGQQQPQVSVEQRLLEGMHNDALMSRTPSGQSTGNAHEAPYIEQPHEDSNKAAGNTTKERKTNQGKSAPENGHYVNQGDDSDECQILESPPKVFKSNGTGKQQGRSHPNGSSNEQQQRSAPSSSNGTIVPPRPQSSQLTGTHQPAQPSRDSQHNGSPAQPRTASSNAPVVSQGGACPTNGQAGLPTTPLRPLTRLGLEQVLKALQFGSTERLPPMLRPYYEAASRNLIRALQIGSAAALPATLHGAYTVLYPDFRANLEALKARTAAKTAQNGRPIANARNEVIQYAGQKRPKDGENTESEDVKRPRTHSLIAEALSAYTSRPSVSPAGPFTPEPSHPHSVQRTSSISMLSSTSAYSYRQPGPRNVRGPSSTSTPPPQSGRSMLPQGSSVTPQHMSPMYSYPAGNMPSQYCRGPMPQGSFAIPQQYPSRYNPRPMAPLPGHIGMMPQWHGSPTGYLPNNIHYMPTPQSGYQSTYEGLPIIQNSPKDNAAIRPVIAEQQRLQVGRATNNGAKSASPLSSIQPPQHIPCSAVAQPTLFVEKSNTGKRNRDESRVDDGAGEDKWVPPSKKHQGQHGNGGEPASSQSKNLTDADRRLAETVRKVSRQKEGSGTTVGTKKHGFEASDKEGLKSNAITGYPTILSNNSINKQQKGIMSSDHLSTTEPADSDTNVHQVKRDSEDSENGRTSQMKPPS
ncbi:MAG: hypothetical protein Q9166_006916 [cf. Caloplaca sp. 2 TL-2023]